MVKFGLPIEVEPHEALLQMLYAASGHAAWLREEVAALDDLGTFEGRVIVQLYGDWTDRVTKISKAALDAGVAERQVALAERYGHALAELLRGIFADPELDLTEAQQARLPDLLRRHLLRAAESQGQRVLVA